MSHYSTGAAGGNALQQASALQVAGARKAHHAPPAGRARVETILRCAWPGLPAPHLARPDGMPADCAGTGQLACLPLAPHH
jgi:hypothetical protein